MSYADQIRVEPSAYNMRSLIADGIEENKSIADSASSNSTNALNTANNANSRVDNIVANQGSAQSTEVIDSRHDNVNNISYTALGNRLDTHSTRLIDISVNIKTFGAVGDGSTDDTQAIQNALDSLTNGGNVLVPRGTYIISSDLKIGDNTTLLGAGINVSIIKRLSGTGTNGCLLKNKNCVGYGGHDNSTFPDYTTITPNYNIVIKDICFDGNRSNNGNTKDGGLLFTLCQGLKIQNVIVKNTLGKGIYLQATKDILLEHSKAINNSLNGVHITDCIQFLVDNLETYGNTDYSLEIGAGDTTSQPNSIINMPLNWAGQGNVVNCNLHDNTSVAYYMRGFNNITIKNVTVKDNYIYNTAKTTGSTDITTGAGIATSDLIEDIKIYNNNIYGNAGSGIYITAGTDNKNFIINSNEIYSNTQKSLYINGLTNSIIKNNYIHENLDGCYLNYLYTCIFEGNVLKDNCNNTAYPLFLTNCQHNTLKNNSIDDKTYTDRYSNTFDIYEENTNADNYYFGNKINNIVRIISATKMDNNSWQKISNVSMRIYYRIGDVLTYLDPTTNSCIGLVCTREGWYPPIWSANTTYLADEHFIRRPTIDNDHVYIPITDGQSSTSEPSWNISTSSTTIDNTVTWKEYGYCASFKKYGALI
ncbi:hypothetical protein NL50_17425 [Clostridium acetobutylicum]|nr:hypothetical protein NL50_17425 [Clostridium acetobutylicum]